MKKMTTDLEKRHAADYARYHNRTWTTEQLEERRARNRASYARNRETVRATYQTNREAILADRSMPENLERAAMLKRTRIAAETMKRYAERLVIEKDWRLPNREKLRMQKREAYKNDPKIKAAQQKYKNTG